MPTKFTRIPMDHAAITAFWMNVRKTDGPGCWLWQGPFHKKGYGLWRASVIPEQTVIASRAAYAYTYGPIPDGMLACHHCDNPPCVRPDHLFLGTHQDNVADRVSKGRSATGLRTGAYTHPERVRRGPGFVVPRAGDHWNAKLTWPLVNSARERYSQGEVTQRQLAAELQTSQAYVNEILQGRAWHDPEYHPIKAPRRRRPLLSS